MRKWPPPLWGRHVMPGLHHHGNCAHYRTCDKNYRQIYLLWRILIWHGNGSINKDLGYLKFSEKSRLLYYGLCMAGIAWRSWVGVLCMWHTKAASLPLETLTAIRKKITKGKINWSNDFLWHLVLWSIKNGWWEDFETHFGSIPLLLPLYNQSAKSLGGNKGR